MTKSDFDEIVLLPKELVELRQFNRIETTTEIPSLALLYYGLVLPDIARIDSGSNPIFSDTFSITEKGIRYLAYQKRCRKIAIGKYFASKWIDFLALVVAIAALIISIIALNKPLPMQ